MNGKRKLLRRLLMAGFVLIAFFTFASIQVGSTPDKVFESTTFTRSITLGVTDTSYSPLLNKIIVLYLRNQGIHTKELNFKDPSRLPLALEHNVIDAYLDIWSLSPGVANQRELLVSRPVFFYAKSELTRANISSVSEVIRYVQENEVRLRIAVDKKIPLDKLGLDKIGKTYGWEIMQDDLVQLDYSLLDTALQEQWVDMAIGWSSDARLINDRIQMLTDDLGIFPSYQIVPRFHGSNRALLEPLLKEVMERLTLKKWLELQYQVDILGEDASTVAMRFLLQERLMRENKSE